MKRKQPNDPCWSEEMANDRAAVLKAVREDYRLLQYASEELRGDREIVLAAVKQDGSVLAEFASVELLADRELVLEAVSKHPYLLEDVAEELQDDRDIILAAIAQDGCWLEFASERLRDDPQVVLAAVSQNGFWLREASERMRGDCRIVMSAVTSCEEALEFAAEAVFADDEFKAFLRERNKRCFMLRVCMLSGRSCILCLDPAVNHLGRSQDKSCIIERSARKLGLDYEEQANAELLVGEGEAPLLPLAQWPGLRLGQLNELQLIIAASSNCT